MGKKLDEMLQDSYAGCISSQTDIMQIIDRLFELTLYELLNITDPERGEQIRNIALDILEVEHNWDISCADTLKYMEFLYLLNSSMLRFPEKYEEDERYKRINKCFSPIQQYRYLGLYHIACALQEADTSSNLIRLFLSINIKTFYEYMDSRTKQKRRISLWTRLNRKLTVLDIKIESNTTIGDVLNQALSVTRHGWGPWMPIGTYCDKILKTYALFTDLFIISFKAAYPERLKDIKPE